MGNRIQLLIQQGLRQDQNEMSLDFMCSNPLEKSVDPDIKGEYDSDTED